jgi:hypothetical protein
LPTAAILFSQIIVPASGGTKVRRSAVPVVEVRGPVAGLPGIAADVWLVNDLLPGSIDRRVARGVPRGWVDVVTLLDPFKLLVVDFEEVLSPFACRLCVERLLDVVGIVWPDDNGLNREVEED